MKHFRTIAINILILSFLLVGLVAILEVLLRVFAPQPVSYFAFPRTPIPGAVMPVMGKHVVLNSYASRDYEYPAERRPGTIRIAAIGDSITFGFGVELEDSYPKVLESMLNQSRGSTTYEVPSFNMGAVDTAWAIRKYTQLVRKFHPDIVILGFCLRGILDYSGFDSNGKPIETKIGLKQKIIRQFVLLHQWLRLKSHLYFLVVERSKPFLYRHFLNIRTKDPDYWIPLEVGTPEYEKRFASTVGLLVRLNKLVKADGARFIVVIFPYEIQLSNASVQFYKDNYRLTMYDDAPKARVQKELTAALAAHGIEYIDLLAPYRFFSKDHPGEPLFFRSLVGVIDWIHPNELGHRIAAQSIASYIIQRSSVSPNPGSAK
jgi:lysophospholipase L1-like esterase